MTPKERVAMQQALTWMEWYDFDTRLPEPDFDVAITALREALAEQAEQEPVANCDHLKQQAEQEPVASYKDAPRIIYLQTGCDDPDPFECGCSFNEWGDVSWCAEKIHDTDIPYVRADYAAPLAKQESPVPLAVRTKDPCNFLQDLTDDEIISALDADMDTDEDKARFLEIARAVIAADREKNK